jgi:hypothetical protein
MPPRPIEYGPTQYPPRYRPLGYHAHGPVEPPSDRSGTGQSRRRQFLVLLGVLLATLLLHAGIAYALRSPGDTARHVVRKSASTSCGPKVQAPIGAFDPGADTGGAGDGSGARQVL